MINALAQFFPEVDASASVLDLVRSQTLSNKDEPIPLQRIMTGASIVGAGNGDRPGGFVLVADGAALLEVSCTESGEENIS